MAGDRSPRNAIAMSLTWWYVRRLIRKRGAAAVAGLVAGEGLSLGRPKKKRHVLRWILLGGVVAGAGIVWWRRRQGGGGDDWGEWQPVAPVPPAPAQPAPEPEPEPPSRREPEPRKGPREVTGGARFVRPSLEQIPAADPTPRLPPGVASLGLNEGLSGPFPSALAAIAAELPRLNRYPGRGSAELVAALAARHEVAAAQVIVAAGADALIGYVCQAVLQPGDEAVIPWPSFPSFVRDAQKRDAVPVLVPSREGVVDLGAVRDAITPRTRLLFLATPNNPTGRMLPRDDVIGLVQELPRHVLPVVDEAYIDYLEPAGRLDTIADLVRAGHDVLALRTFSKLYGLAGLRVGFGVGPAAVVSAMRKVQRGYDVGTLAQAAALASLDDDDEVTRRRAANRAAMATLGALVRARGLEPLSGSATNFVLVDVRRDADEVSAALLRSGVAVQSGAPFGAPTAVRIGAGSEEDLAMLDAALAAAGFSAR